ncbi:MAG: hypothetical protein V7776_19570 [Halopseudomonas aestusnigri]
MVDNTVDLKDDTARDTDQETNTCLKIDVSIPPFGQETQINGDNLVLTRGRGENTSQLVFLNLVTSVENNGRDPFLDIGNVPLTLGQFVQVIDPNTKISGK